MMYPYVKLRDDIEVVHSHIIKDGDVQKVIVHFEQPIEGGFRFARCELPSYQWIRHDGFDKEDLEFFLLFLENNYNSIYKSAEDEKFK